jgi:hypothetical protein
LLHGKAHPGIGRSTSVAVKPRQYQVDAQRAETGDQGAEKSGINLWEGGGKRTKGLRSALRIPGARSAATRRRGKRSPEMTRYTGTGRRNKGCRSCLPLHGLTEWRELPGLRGSRRIPMPFHGKTSWPPRLSSNMDCIRPLPKWKRTGRARGAEGLFLRDSNAGAFMKLYPPGRWSGNNQPFKFMERGRSSVHPCGPSTIP